ncbi:unnamed protein product [Prorocentrum cordatum]|uniref:Subtilisin n=1 Tax=Prorocentrum cordatum TaxID=2364126 RepID=A0ABN9RM07_9DINO|nr:unnamed protein product [Polarella glacialis]
MGTPALKLLGAGADVATALMSGAVSDCASIAASGRTTTMAPTNLSALESDAGAAAPWSLAPFGSESSPSTCSQQRPRQEEEESVAPHVQRAPMRATSGLAARATGCRTSGRALRCQFLSCCGEARATSAPAGTFACMATLRPVGLCAPEGGPPASPPVRE